jgi:plasmid stability protein
MAFEIGGGGTSSPAPSDELTRQLQEIILDTQRTTSQGLPTSLPPELSEVALPQQTGQPLFNSEDLDQRARSIYGELENLRKSLTPETELESALKPEHPIYRFLENLGIAPKSVESEELKSIMNNMIKQIQSDLDLLSKRKQELQSQNSIEFVTKNILPLLVLVNSVNPELVRTILPMAILSADRIKEGAIEKLDATIRQRQTDMLSQLQTALNVINQEERRRISAGQLAMSGLRLMAREKVDKIRAEISAIGRQLTTIFNQERLKIQKEQNIQRFASDLADRVLRYEQFVLRVLRDLPSDVDQEQRVRIAMMINQVRDEARNALMAAIRGAEGLTESQKRMLAQTYSGIFQPLSENQIMTIAQYQSVSQIMAPYQIRLALARIPLLQALTSLAQARRQEIIMNQDIGRQLIRTAMNSIATSNKIYDSAAQTASNSGESLSLRVGAIQGYTQHLFGSLTVAADAINGAKSEALAKAEAAKDQMEKERIEKRYRDAENAITQLFLDTIAKAEALTRTLGNSLDDDGRKKAAPMLQNFWEDQMKSINSLPLSQNAKDRITARIKTAKESVPIQLRLQQGTGTQSTGTTTPSNQGQGTQSQSSGEGRPRVGRQ